MSRGAAPSFYGLGPSKDAWGLVIKVKYGDTLKRFIACANGPHIDHNLAVLRSKIISAFKFSPDDEFTLTYTDEDGDVVMLDDDSDLRDAAISQKLNPLRINVQLKSSSAGAPQTKQQASNSISPMSTALEDQLAQVKSAIDEALKFVPEQVPIVLAKLSHDLRSKAASSAPSLAELLDRFAKLMTPKSNMQPSSGPSDTSGSSSDGPQTLGNLKVNQESELTTDSASQPPDMQNYKSSKAHCVKSMLIEEYKSQVEQSSGYPLVEDPLISASSHGEKVVRKGSKDPLISASQPPDMKNYKSSKAHRLNSMLIEEYKAQVEQSSGYPLVEDPLISASSRGEKVVRKGSKDAQSKGKARAQSKWKSVISPAASPVATIAHGVSSLRSAPAPFIGENTVRYGLNPDYMPFTSDGKISGDFHSIFPPPLPVPSYCPIPSLRANGKINGDLHSTCPPPTHNYPPQTYSYNPFKLNMPSSVSPYGPYPDGVYSLGGSYRDVIDNYDSVPQRTLHRWVQCDGCGVTPIAGPRYKSNVKDGYDLCSSCFSHMGNEAEYTRIDRPTLASESWRDENRRHRSWLQKDKLECHFIADVSVPDGTLLAPSTPFTKIWRIRNNGSTMWPFGTQLVWDGGEKFARQSSIKLGIPMDGFPVDHEIDVGADFVAPPKPGRYRSYWRLASPSGQKFGQPVWVLIQVEQHVQTSGNKQQAAINLNLPPDGNSTKWKPFIDMNVEPTDPVYEFPGSTRTEWFPSVVPSAPTAVEPVQVPITDPHTSSTGPVSSSMPVSVPAPPLGVPASARAPVNVPAAAPVSMPVPVHAPAVSVPAAPSPDEIVNHMEEKLLRELEEMGFSQVDLNKEILRQNKYNLEQSVDDLCGFHESTPRGAA